MDRPIFIDNVLGLETVAIAQRDHRPPAARPIARHSASKSPISPIRLRRPGCKGASRGADKGISFTPEGKKAILYKLIEARRASNTSSIRNTPAQSGSGLRGARRRFRRWSRSSSAAAQLGVKRHRDRHAPPRPAECAGKRDGKAVPRDVQRVQGRLGEARRGRGIGRCKISPGHVVGPGVRRQHRAPVADRQSVASGSCRPRGARQGTCQTGTAQG